MPFTDSINVVEVVIADKKLINATPSDVLDGKMYIGTTHKLETGNIPINPERSDIQLVNGDNLNIPFGYNPQEYNITVQSIGDATPGTATDIDILDGKTAWIKGIEVTGVMPNIGTENDELLAGESHKISYGFHNGKGVITTKTLLEQTPSSMSSDDLKVGSSAWSNGKFVEGTMPDNGAVSQQLKCGEKYIVHKGYHNGNGVVSALPLSAQTHGTAHAGVIVDGYTAWVDGQEITGTLPINEPQNIDLPINGTYAIPFGYHTGRGIVSQNIPTRQAITVTPAKEIQTIRTDGFYMQGNITVKGVDALNYGRPRSAIIDSTGKEVADYPLTVKENKSTIFVSVDNWHDNATLNVYRIVSNDLTDSTGTVIPVDMLIMCDWVEGSQREYKLGNITISVYLENNSNAQKIVFNNVKSGIITITEPFHAREYGVEEGPDIPLPPIPDPPIDPEPDKPIGVITEDKNGVVDSIPTEELLDNIGGVTYSVDKQSQSLNFNAPSTPNRNVDILTETKDGKINNIPPEELLGDIGGCTYTMDKENNILSFTDKA